MINQSATSDLGSFDQLKNCVKAAPDPFAAENVLAMPPEYTYRKLNALRAIWETIFATSGSTLESFGQPVVLTELK
ncbi:MAG: hypothetical protein JAY90_07185 [Candidatus Thiodiazotropha lotti]|nr:hypothetical protein [Candidatus Thiodiazotropha lotti]MCG7982525.1 hypothetical protein [Candidatus Thiodiazotropha lotti]MCW4222801.1 hypothetical protein [Candidatus Thiodiazotropha lotti]